MQTSKIKHISVVACNKTTTTKHERLSELYNVLDICY